MNETLTENFQASDLPWFAIEICLLIFFVLFGILAKTGEWAECSFLIFKNRRVVTFLGKENFKLFEYRKNFF